MNNNKEQNHSILSLVSSLDPIKLPTIGTHSADEAGLFDETLSTNLGNVYHSNNELEVQPNSLIEVWSILMVTYWINHNNNALQSTLAIIVSIIITDHD